jgi:hypothetical protein
MIRSSHIVGFKKVLSLTALKLVSISIFTRRPMLTHYFLFHSLTGNRLMCDCRILWIQKLYRDTESDYVKNHLNKTQCDLFLTPEQKLRELNHGVSVSYNSNITVVAAPPEETTSYAFDSSKFVMALNSEDFKCHEQQNQKNFSSGSQAAMKKVGSHNGNHEEDDHIHESGKNHLHHHNQQHEESQSSNKVKSQHQSHTDTSSQISGNDPILISKGATGGGSSHTRNSYVFSILSILSFTYTVLLHHHLA